MHNLREVFNGCAQDFEDHRARAADAERPVAVGGGIPADVALAVGRTFRRSDLAPVCGVAIGGI